MPFLQTVCVVGIFATSLVLILTRPHGVTEGMFALGGGVAMLLVGAVTPREAVATLVGSWNVFLFFLGMLLVAALADQAGIFDWVAGLAARSARGSSLRLFVSLFLLGTVITAVLSNDATALLLTPVVFALATRLGLPPRPYAFACSFVANAASLMVPVANPANILILEAVPMGLATFWAHLLLPGIAVLSVTFAGLWLVFRRDLTMTFPVAEAASHTSRDGWFHVTLGGLGLLMVGYLVASWLAFPLGPVAVGGAAAMLLGGTVARRINLRAVGSEVTWGIFPFLAGMLVLIQAIENAGATRALSKAVAGLSDQGAFPALLITASGAALGSNLINNLPMAMVAASSLHTVADDPATRHGLAAAAILGVDIGPNLTTIGSLSTMLWLLLLRRRGLDVTGLEFLKVGVLVMPPAIICGMLALWVTERP